MMVATAAQMKELDRQAIEEYGIPSLDLMEHAAQAVANEVRELLKGYKNPLIGGAVSAIIMAHQIRFRKKTGGEGAGAPEAPDNFR